MSIEQIAELIVKLIAAMTALTTAIVGLCSIIVRLVPVLAKDNPLLPTVKLLGKVALNTPPVNDEERPKNV